MTRRVVIVSHSQLTGDIIEGEWTVIGEAESQEQAEALARKKGYAIGDEGEFCRDQLPGEYLGGGPDAYTVPILV